MTARAPREAASDLPGASAGPSAPESAGETAADVLRRAADRIEEVREVQRQDLTDPWATPYLRASLHPWVALMGPELAEPLAAWLRAEAHLADLIDRRPDPAAQLLGIEQERLPMWADSNPPALVLARALLEEEP